MADIKKNIEKAGDWAAEKAQEAGDRVSETAEKVGDWAKEKAHQAQHRAQEVTHKVKDQACDSDKGDCRD
jgi:hypothetical protein